MDMSLPVLEIKSKILVLVSLLNMVTCLSLNSNPTFFHCSGDGGVDINPIGDLLKSEVRTLARELNLDQSITNAAPTDGLFGDQRTDEVQIGATYDELEWAMKQIENGKENEQNVMNERQKKVLNIYLQRHQANEHKMKKIPSCIIPNELKQSMGK